MQVRRDKKIPVAILKDYDEAIISQAYPVFRVVDETKLLPDYLMMWMSREEFDREACFLAVGGVRGSLEWEDFLDMELPVPSIEKQRDIVAEYNAVVGRIELNEQINQKLEETAKAIYRQWFEEFEFPISKELAAEMGKPELVGQPYKSSGGEMVYNEELDGEIPKGWERISIQDLIDRELIHPNRDGNHGELHPKSSDYVDEGIPFIMANDIVNGAIDFENCKFIPKEISDNLRIPPSKTGDVLITHKGTMGRVTIVPEIDIPIVLTPQVTFYRVKQKKKITKEFLYGYFKSSKFQQKLISESDQSTRKYLGITKQRLFKLILPDEEVIQAYSLTANEIFSFKNFLINENYKLNSLQTLLLSKMSVSNKEIEMV